MDIEEKKIAKVEQSGDEISLKDLFTKISIGCVYLKRKWRLILISSVIGITLGYIYSIIEKPNYIALTTFALEEDKGGSGGIGGALGIASQFGIDIGGASGGGAFSTLNLPELMKSRFIIEKTLLNIAVQNKDTITLAEMYLRTKKLKSKWESNPRLSNISFPVYQKRNTFSLLQDSVLFYIYKKICKENLVIQQKDKKITIFSVQVNSENELFSKSLCDGLVKETSKFYIESKSRKAKTNVEILQKQSDSVRNELNQAISGVANSVDKVYNLNPAFNIKGAQSKKLQVDVQANTEILKQLVIQLELAKVTLRKETPLIQYIDLPILPLEKEKTGKLSSIFIGLVICVIGMIFYLALSRAYNKIMLS